MAVPRSIALPFLFAASAMAASAQEDLPRALILGDSIYRQPAAKVAKELKGKVEVVFASIQPGEVRNSSTALSRLDEWLGEGKWDLIHFNFGLGDLVYRAPEMKSFRVFPKQAGGVRATSPDRYEKNLRELVPRLQATGAELVWASTTPIRHSATGVFVKGSEVEYNAIAARVMKGHGVPINDMHGHVVKLIDMDKPAGHNADPFSFDKKPVHAPIVEAILANLP